MTGDEQIRHMIERVDFPGEPAMTAMAADDVRRGQRRLRGRRMATWASGVAGVAVLATGVAVALPGGGEAPGQDPGVAAGGGADDEAAGPPTPTEAPAGHMKLPFASTRQLLLDTAVEHLDPERTHLPDSATGFSGGGGGGGMNVGTKLGWTVPGESGQGMIKVAVTTPGYASSEEHARTNFAVNLGCETGSSSCTEQAIPGSAETALVAEADPDADRVLSVVYERVDGSLVGIGVYDLFGNNTTQPVSSVDVGLDQAFAFVTDPDLQVDADEVEEGMGELSARGPEGEGELPVGEAPDYSDTEELPAPPAEEMNAAEAEAVVRECVDGAHDWSGFSPTFGIRLDADAEESTPTGWVIAHEGDSRLVCGVDSSGQSTGGARFGDSAAKDVPYMFAPVETKDPGFGLYTSDIARVTVQASGGPEQDAVMRDGYWFLPVEDADHVTLALRGYDAEGDLVYDSATDGPDFSGCFTDPEGTEVVYEGDVTDPALDDCAPTYAWEH